MFYAATKEIELNRIELDMVLLLAKGSQSKDIAKALGKSRGTIEGYVRLLYAKLAARSRAQLVARAYELGLIESFPPER